MANSFSLFRNLLRPSLSIIQFIKFSVVGGMGTLTNLGIYTVLVKYTDLLVFDVADNPVFDSTALELFLASTLCFFIAASQNYFLNEKWTFNFYEDNDVNKNRYAKFLTFSLLALSVNLAFLYFVLKIMEKYWFVSGVPHDSFWVIVPQAFGILAGMGINFIMSKYITFKRE